MFILIESNTIIQDCIVTEFTSYEEAYNEMQSRWNKVLEDNKAEGEENTEWTCIESNFAKIDQENEITYWWKIVEVGIGKR